MGRKNDLSGRTFGTLLVLRRSENKNPKNALWIAECKKCGSIKEYKAPELGGTRISCGCIGSNAYTGDKSPEWKGVGNLSKTQYSRIKKTAERRKIEFNVSIEYLWKLCEEQEQKCKYTKVDLTFGKTTRKKSSGNASLDRIDSSIGYVEGNVQWVLKDINMMKQQFTNEHFKELCKMVVENL
jgi:hypothetical protein